MTKTEISNWDIQFRVWESSAFASACQILPREQRITLYTSVRQKPTAPSFLEPFTPNTCEYSSKVTIPQRNSNTVYSDQTINGWIAYVREEFYSIPQVEAIYLAIKENNVDIWLLIPNRDFGLVRQLVDREMKLLECLVDVGQPLFLFEFHIVYRCGAEESELVPRDAIRLPR